MAAITRAFLPQLFVHSFKPRARNLPLPCQTRPKTRTVSKYARLQPSFPDEPDENLFEPFSEEYETPEDVMSTTRVEKAHPCDVLAAAATSGDVALGESLLQEYTTAKIDIVHRPAYAKLALAGLQRGDVDSMLTWLSLVPSAQAKPSVQHPANDEGIVQLLNVSGIMFDKMMKLLHLYCLKGWSGPVPEQIVGILAGFIPTDEYLRTFANMINLREKAVGTSADERALIVHRRRLAIQKLAKRNNPEAAWHLLREDFDAVLALDQTAVAEIYQAARRTGSSIAALLRQIQTDRNLDLLDRKSSQDQGTLKDRTLTNLAKRVDNLDGQLSVHGKQKLTEQVVATIRALKRLLVSQGEKPDPKAVAYLLLALMKAKSPHDFVSLFRRRISRLGDAEGQTLWGVVECELLCLQDDSHSAIHYYRQAFNTHAAPFFLRGVAIPQHWNSWLSKPPLRTPPLPSSRLTPSYAARLAVWKAAVTLSMVAPEDHAEGAFSKLVKSEDGENFIYDTTHFRALFKDFLHNFDVRMKNHRAAFSNVHTRARFFELFIKKATDVDPEFCSEVMAAMQQRDVLLDHRVWFAYSKHKVLSGEPGFLLKIVQLLEQEFGQPDFSPAALRDEAADGRRLGGTNSVQDVWMPQKVFSAYRYAYKQFLRVGAYDEALQLHLRVVSAGYVAGSSMSFDRLAYRLMEELRTRIKEARLESSRSQIRDQWESDVVYST